MSDMISRLKLESGEFDSKVKRAVTGIQRMAQECHAAGGELTYLEDENRDFIKSLGSMETVAQSARGKLSELTAGFTDLKQIYNALSDEEKKGEFGQELNKQLDIMKGRITDAKQEFNDINKELGDTGKEAKSTGGFMQQLSDKFVVNIDAMKLFDLGLQAVKGALNVAKDAFFASEASIDEWGRSTRTAGDLYDGFLYSINTGDISGYLSRIDEIVSAAKEAYNELDRLSTQKAINNAATQGQRVENERIRTMLRTGRYIAPADGRAPAPGLKEGDLLTKQQLATLAKQLGYGQEKLNKFIRDDIKQAGKVIDALYKEEAKELGLSLSDFRKGTSNMAEFDKRIEGYRQYVAYNNKYGVTDMQGYFHKPKNNPYQNFAAWGVFQDDGETFTAINNLINERAGYQSQLYSTAGANYRAINKGTGGRRGGGGGRKPYVAQTQVLNMGDAWTAPFSGNATATLGGLQGGIEMFDFSQSMKDLSDTIKQRGGIAWTNKTNEQIFEDWSKEFNSMTGGITNIAKGIESMGIEIPSALKKGLSILNTISTVLGIIQSIMTISETANKFMQITQVGMAIATHGAAGAHNGGIIRAAGGYTVPGNYGFDAVPALLTSGELVLNRAQQSRLAGVLRDRAQSGGTGSVRISGEDIYIAVSNFMQRRGYGEIAVGR